MKQGSQWRTAGENEPSKGTERGQGWRRAVGRGVRGGRTGGRRGTETGRGRSAVSTGLAEAAGIARASGLVRGAHLGNTLVPPGTHVLPWFPAFSMGPWGPGLPLHLQGPQTPSAMRPPGCRTGGGSCGTDTAMDWPVTNKDDTEQQGWGDRGVAGSPLGSQYTLTPQPWKQPPDTMLGKPSPLCEIAGGACDIMTHLPYVQERAP